jgi:hypothetical protein
MGPDDHRRRETDDDISWNADRSRDETRSFDRDRRDAYMSDRDRTRYEARNADDHGWSQSRGDQDRSHRDPPTARSSYAAGERADTSYGYDRGYGSGHGPDRSYSQSGSDYYGARDRGDWRGREPSPSWERERSASWGRDRSRDYPETGYAPGAQIWRSSDAESNRAAHHDFEPDYLHWREQQMSTLDKDYSDWRNERRQKFSSDFDSWRQTRAHGPKIEGENPVVGDVSDGGVGTQHKKS